MLIKFGFLTLLGCFFSANSNAGYICLFNDTQAPYGRCVVEVDGFHCKRYGETGTICTGGSATEDDN
jgi:hypothetical protein